MSVLGPVGCSNNRCFEKSWTWVGKSCYCGGKYLSEEEYDLTFDENGERYTKEMSE
jgi:hypothetical protein